MKKKFTCVMMALLTTALLAVGCGSEAQHRPLAVAYVVGNHANREPVNFGSHLVRDTAVDAALSYGCISVVNADGNSQYMGSQDLDIEDRFKGAAKDKLRRDAKDRANSVLGYMQALVADDPEVDYLQALNLAARSLDGYDFQYDKRIVFLGTGLSTTGTLDFNNNLLSAEPEAVVEALSEIDAIPDLGGIRVIFEGLGEVGGDQPALSSHQHKCLSQIWQGIVEAGGGTFEDVSTPSLPMTAHDDMPPVSVVELPEESPVAFSAEQLAAEGLEHPLSLDEARLGFYPDSASYLDGKEAERLLAPVAEYMSNQEEGRLLLVGCTAGDDNDETALRLSAARAAAVKATLVQQGVASSRIETLGLGCGDPWHIYGVGYEGTAARANRKVVLMDADSAMARQLLG